MPATDLRQSQDGNCKIHMPFMFFPLTNIHSHAPLLTIFKLKVIVLWDQEKPKALILVIISDFTCPCPPTLAGSPLPGQMQGSNVNL